MFEASKPNLNSLSKIGIGLGKKIKPFFAGFSCVAEVADQKNLNKGGYAIDNTLIGSHFKVESAIQVIIQTTLLVDGLRRCSNSRKLRRSKPGREFLMFLLIGNVAMWLLYTFSYKAPDSLDERYEFYGKVLWSILGHVYLPLIMFYRFHSSVCFADIWGAAYKPGSDH